MSRMDGMRNKSVYECFGMCHVGEGRAVKKAKSQEQRSAGDEEGKG